MKKFIKENWQRIICMLIVGFTIINSDKIPEITQLWFIILSLVLLVWNLEDKIDRLEEKLNETNERNKKIN